METIFTVTDVEPVAGPSTNGRSLLTGGSFVLGCLKAIVRAYVEAASLFPFWIWVGAPPPTSAKHESPR